MPSDPSKVPVERQIPVESPGLPAHLDFDPAAPFWKPSGLDILRHLGWRSILFLPAILALAFLVACLFWPGLFVIILQLGVKPVIILLAIPVALTAWAVRSAVRARKDPFCIHCGQCLLGLPEVYRCPECGRPYDLALIEDYRRDPQWFAQRWRMRYSLPSPDAQVVVPANARRRKSRDGT